MHAEPCSNPLDRDWESDAKKWEATSRDWETLARISNLQMKVTTSIKSLAGNYWYCIQCRKNYGEPYGCFCKCSLLAKVDEAFRGELESLKENPENVEFPLPQRSKRPISYLCSALKTILYSQRYQQRSTS